MISFSIFEAGIQRQHCLYVFTCIAESGDFVLSSQLPSLCQPVME